MKDEGPRDLTVDNVFKQLDTALCLWSRAHGDNPQKSYFEEVTPGTRYLQLGDICVMVTVSPPETATP